ncbi:MAG: hypothetical protein RLZZ513_1387, partial [Pseudomonadota bacterium]
MKNLKWELLSALFRGEKKAPFVGAGGGSGEIRTHGGRKPSPVFKTGALNHSATLPRKQRRE